MANTREPKELPEQKQNETFQSGVCEIVCRGGLDEGRGPPPRLLRIKAAQDYIKGSLVSIVPAVEVEFYLTETGSDKTVLRFSVRLKKCAEYDDLSKKFKYIQDSMVEKMKDTTCGIRKSQVLGPFLSDDSYIRSDRVMPYSPEKQVVENCSACDTHYRDHHLFWKGRDASAVSSSSTVEQSASSEIKTAPALPQSSENNSQERRRSRSP
ncbi:MAG TPA: hypothetical protein VLJ15_05790 [Gammaproteobacteria bacterium]|nr:hypothetical protein [Gammaproteobacteria bacterium]